MKVPVVVSSAPGRGAWLSDCLSSIGRGDITVCVSRTGGELGAIRMIYEGTHWSRWLLLQDSCEVLDGGLFDLVDATPGSALLGPRPAMYMAVYEREILDRIGFPDVPAGVDRSLAIQHETAWMDRYEVAHRELRGASVPVLFPTFRDADAPRQVWRHGRLNLVLECPYLRKYKGTWH